LPKSVISDKRLQFVVELTKELNRMLEIKTKLSTVFYLQTDRQIEQRPGTVLKVLYGI